MDPSGHLRHVVGSRGSGGAIRMLHQFLHFSPRLNLNPAYPALRSEIMLAMYVHLRQ